MQPEQIAKKTESSQQTAFFCWVAQQVKNCPALKWIHAIPNGGERNKIVASRMKGEGVRAGVWDVFFPYPVGTYHGLYIEFKKPGLENHKNGGMSDAQVEFQKHITECGYATKVVYDWLQAANAVVEYLASKPV